MRGFVHQIRAGRTPKSLLVLVQGKRRNRVLRGIVHQIRTGRTPKRHPNLVQRKRRNRVLRGIVHQVRAGGAPPRKALRRPRQKITKSVKTPGASGSVPLLSGLAASQYFLGFDGFKSAGSSYFPELSISSWMS